MYRPSTAVLRVLRGTQQELCPACQWRALHQTARRRQVESKPAAPAPSPLHTKPTFAPLPRPQKDAEEPFVPQPLPRPIGLPSPPISGQNSGRDTRTWRQKKDDFLSYDKKIEKRIEIGKAFNRPYFRDWSNLKYEKGKSFLAPTSLFRADKALWFPNFVGGTLKEPGAERDTTEVLEGKVSVVSIFSGQWADRQVNSFTGKQQHLELQAVLDGEGVGVAQRVKINVEDRAMRGLILRIFLWNLRRQHSAEEQSRYFILNREVSENIRESIGLLNRAVGYTYLVDGRCRIRWAASADAVPTEKESMVKCLRRLIKEEKEGVQKTSSL